MKTMLFTAILLVTILSSIASAVPLTYKGEAVLNTYDQNGNITSQTDVGPCFNVGNETGWNSGTRDQDHGPQIAIMSTPLGFIPIPWNCPTCY